MDPISYCLACCGEVDKKGEGVECGIKQEVEEEVTSNVEIETGLFNTETVTLKTKKEPDMKTNSALLYSPAEEKDCHLLDCFLKIFCASPLSKNEMWRDPEKREGGDIPINTSVVLPFCGVCRCQLSTLYRLQEKMEKVEQELKEKVRNAEPEFERRNVYQNDKRYLKIRRKILRDKGQGENASRKKLKEPKKQGQAPVNLGETSSSETKVNIPESSSESSTFRRSSNRASKPVSRFGAAIPLPIVLLSKEDKCRAEKYKQSSPSKSEPLMDAKASDGDDEDGDDLSAIDPIYEPSSPASPSHSWSHEEDDEKEGEDESDSWMPPSPSCDDSRQATSKNKTNNRTRKRGVVSLKGQVVKIKRRPGRPRKDGEEPLPIKIKRKAGRPKKYREEPLPGPKIKFKKNSLTTIDRKTGTITILKVALTRMEDGLSYKCSLCSEIFPNKKDRLTRHVIKKHSDRYKCHLCNRNLSSKRMLKIHLRVHTGAAPEIVTECPTCAKPFTRRALLRTHIFSHYSEQERNEAVARGEKLPPGYNKKFQCDQCAWRFSSNILLKKHLISIHQTEERPKELCPICGCAVLHLQAHISRVHEEVPDEKKFACSLCSKKFNTNVLLRRHKNVVHFDIKQFNCTMCTKKFPSKWHLQEHMFLHLNIRKFQCQFCSSAFVKKFHLQRHVKVYHEEGSAPKRPQFIRGLERKCFKKTDQSSSNSSNQLIHEDHGDEIGGEESSGGASFKREVKNE